jgi:hypothetical protein
VAKVRQQRVSISLLVFRSRTVEPDWKLPVTEKRQRGVVSDLNSVPRGNPFWSEGVPSPLSRSNSLYDEVIQQFSHELTFFFHPAEQARPDGSPTFQYNAVLCNA